MRPIHRLCRHLRLLPLLVLASCSSSIYLPGAAHTPMFNGEGDLQVTASAGSNLEFGGSIAYSPIYHLGFVAGVGHNPITHTDTIFDHGHTFGDLGVVYYTGLSGRTTQLELSAGVGLGDAAARSFTPYRETDIGPLPYPDSITTFSTMNGSYMRYYLQGLFGVRANMYGNPVIEYGFGGRLVRAQFHELVRDDRSLAPVGTTNFEFLAFMRANFERVGFEMQFGTTTPIPQTELFDGNFQVTIATRIALGTFYDDFREVLD